MIRNIWNESIEVTIHSVKYLTGVVELFIFIFIFIVGARKIIIEKVLRFRWISKNEFQCIYLSVFACFPYTLFQVLVVRYELVEHQENLAFLIVLNDI